MSPAHEGSTSRDTSPSKATSILSSDMLPPMILLPKKIMEINESISRTKAELDTLNRQIAQHPIKSLGNDMSSKQLHYLQRGMWHELQDLIAAKKKMEQDELDNIILPVTQVTREQSL
jgi:hypothetical protein